MRAGRPRCGPRSGRLPRRSPPDRAPTPAQTSARWSRPRPENAPSLPSRRRRTVARRFCSMAESAAGTRAPCSARRSSRSLTTSPSSPARRSSARSSRWSACQTSTPQSTSPTARATGTPDPSSRPRVPQLAPTGGASRLACSASTLACPHRWPGSRSPAGRTRSTATCMPTAKTPSTSTRGRRSSPRAGNRLGGPLALALNSGEDDSGYELRVVPGRHMAASGQLDLLHPLRQDAVAQGLRPNQRVVLGPGERDRRLDPLQFLDPPGAHQRARLVVGRSRHVGPGNGFGLTRAEPLGVVDEAAEGAAAASRRGHDRAEQRGSGAATAPGARDRVVRGRRRALPETRRAERDHRARTVLSGALDRRPTAQGDAGDRRLSLDAERLAEVQRSGGEIRRAWLDAVGQLGRLTEPRHVDCDHIAFGRQSVNYRRPLDQRSPEGVEEQKRVPLPPPYVVQLSRAAGPGATHRSRSYST